MRRYFVLICIASLGLAFFPHISTAQVSGYVVPKDATFAEGLAIIQKAQADPRQTNEFSYAYLGKTLGWRKVADGEKDYVVSDLRPVYIERTQAGVTDPLYVLHTHPPSGSDKEFSFPSGGDLLNASRSKLDAPRTERNVINLVVETSGVWSYGVRTDVAAERIVREEKEVLSHPLFSSPEIQADIAKYKAAGVFPNGYAVTGNDRLAGHVMKDIIAGKYGKEPQDKLVEAFKKGADENFFIVTNIALKRYTNGVISFEDLKKLYDSYGLSLSRGDAEATAAAVEQTNFNDTFGIKPTVQKEGTLEAGKGLVPCSGFNCSVCDVVVMANTAIKLLLTLSFLFFAILAVRAGLKLLVSQGNSSALSDAKQSFTNAFIGLIIILVAWLIVDTMMRQLLKGGNGNIDGYGPWSKVQCTTQVQPGEAKTGQFAGDKEFESSGVVAGGTSLSPVSESGMTSLNSLGVNVANNYKGISDPGRTDLVHPTAANAILRMQNAGKQQYGKQPFQVTAAYTRNVGHDSNSFHYKGVAIDLQPINGISKEQVATLARAAGFSYVLIEKSHVHVDMR